MLADVEPKDVGQWMMVLVWGLGGLALVLNILGSWKRINRQQADGERFITHREFQMSESGLRKRIRGLAKTVGDMRLDLAKQPQQMRDMIDEVNRPLCRSLARIGSAVIAICVKMGIEPPDAGND